MSDKNQIKPESKPKPRPTTTTTSSEYRNLVTGIPKIPTKKTKK